MIAENGAAVSLNVFGGINQTCHLCKLTYDCILYIFTEFVILIFI